MKNCVCLVNDKLPVLQSHRNSCSDRTVCDLSCFLFFYEIPRVPVYQTIVGFGPSKVSNMYVLRSAVVYRLLCYQPATFIKKKKHTFFMTEGILCWLFTVDVSSIKHSEDILHGALLNGQVFSRHLSNVDIQLIQSQSHGYRLM